MDVCGFFQPIILFPLHECLTFSHVLYIQVLLFFKVQLKWGLRGYHRSLFWMHIAHCTSPMTLTLYLVICSTSPVGCFYILSVPNKYLLQKQVFGFTESFVSMLPCKSPMRLLAESRVNVFVPSIKYFFLWNSLWYKAIQLTALNSLASLFTLAVPRIV